MVQVVRHPVGYVRSAQDWGAYRFGGRPLNLLPYRRLAPPQFHPWNPAERVRWAGEDQFERLAWAWSAMNQAMRTQGEADPGSGRSASRTSPIPGGARSCSAASPTIWA